MGLRSHARTLNISFLITSSGLVSAAPATPAATDFAAELHRTWKRWPGAPSGTEGGGSRAWTKSCGDGWRRWWVLGRDAYLGDMVEYFSVAT